MNEPSGPRFDDLDLELERQIDAICRRFEADWRAGKRPAIDDYLAEIPNKGRPALRAELAALESELRQSDDTMARPQSTGASEAPLPATVAEAPTMAPGPPPTLPLPGAAPSAVHQQATLPPRDDATVDLGSADPAQPETPSPTRVRYFGDYEIVREIARGGMGVVFQARQVSLNRAVALKMILSGQLANDTDIKRFYTEAEAAANLDHPGIVPIFEVGQHEGQHYFSMGFIEGQSLSQRLADGPLPPREAATLMVKVAEAIEYAHRRGVIHRDLKPANILLDQFGNPRVTDFGLAKKLEGDSGLTGSGQIMGTPSYMPPEQAGGNRGAVGPAADVYALGATLYCGVTGRPPFQAANVMDTVLQVISEEPAPPRRLNPAVERDLETICLKCLEKDLSRRYGSAAELGHDLRRFLDGEPIVARPVTAWERAWKWAQRRPAIAALCAATALATVLGVAGIAWQWRKAEANFTRAETNLAEANRQRAVAEKKTREATEATESVERQLYINRVNLAQREWMSNSSSAADDLLNRCPPHLRDWEWSYIRRLCHPESLVIQAGMSGLAFSPDGRRVVSAGPEHRVKIWDTIRGDLVFTITGHSEPVFTIAFSPDGRLLATGSQDKTIKLWDAATGTLIRTLEPHGSWIRSVAFSPDGTRLVSGSGAELFTPKKTSELILWEVATGRELRRFAGPHDRIYGVAYRPDGRQIASINCESSVKLWDPEADMPQRVLVGHTYYIDCVAYSPDGRTLATGSRDQSAILWDVATGKILHVLRGHDSHVKSLAFSPDGKTLITGDWGAAIKVWDVSGGAEVTHFRGSSSVSNVQFSPDGRFLATAGRDNLVKLWETRTLANIESRALDGHRGWCFRAEYTRDGRTLATTGWGLVRLWDAASGRHVRDIETGIPTGVYGLAIRPDGRVIATAQERGPKEVDLWDAATGQRLRKLVGHGATVKCVAFHPEGRTLASAGEDRTIRLWDASDGRPIAVLEGHSATVDAIAFSPDGKWLASKGWDHTVRLWDVATRRAIRVHEGVGQRPSDTYANGVAFSPDGPLLAAARGDGRVNLWNTETGAEVLTLSGHGGPVNSVAFLGARRIVSTSNDRTIKLWDLVTGETVLTLRGHTGQVIGVACRPDGTQFATTGSDDGRLWDASMPSAEDRREVRIRAWVESLHDRHPDKTKVVEAIQADVSLADSDRTSALRIAKAMSEDPLTMSEDPLLLNNTSWLLAREPKRTPDEYRRAVRYAEAACRLVPQESTFVNTLGDARYRAGQYREALDDLNRSLKLNAAQFGGPSPADLAFLAMAQHRLGQNAEARKTLDQLHDAMSKKPWSDDDESEAFSDEAISLIAGAEPPIVEVGRFLGHDPGAEVQMLVVSRDGLRILSGSSDKTMILWDRATGKIIRRFRGHVGSVRSVAILPDGHRGLSADEAGKVVRLWDLESGQPIREFGGHLESIFSLTVSPNGRLAYSGGGSRTDFSVRVWDVEAGQGVRQLEGHTGMVWSLAVSPDGRRVLSAGNDGNAILWDATTGAEIRRFRGDSAGVQCVAFLPDGHRAVSSGFDRTIRLWDIESGRELHRFLGHPREVTCVAVSPDGRRLLSSDYPGRELRLWDVEGRKLIRRIGWAGISPTRGSFSPDSRNAVWGGTDGVVRLYRLPAFDGADRPTTPAQPDRPDPGRRPETKK
jgi:eukaryotic-like serine/threonine-protein kinase